MCGINGIILKNASDYKIREVISAMNETIIHRGPDDAGIFVDSRKEQSLAMGMRRLSIIDLNSGHQPIFSEDKQQVIVFNGEIYNYRELRAELSNKGVNFLTQSDTEVILQIYRTYGVKGLRKLDGMYAFSIYDKNLNKVFIGRDFFGEKPLYYTQIGKSFYWASELKSMIKGSKSTFPISIKGLNLFFRLTYIPAPFTIYEGVYKLRPNHMLVYNLDKNSYIIEEINPHSVPEKINIPFGEARSRVRDMVEKSVESRSVSDVPIGTFLSGGVDSSIVSLCLSRINAKKINTFSIGFDKKGFDETDKSQTVAKLIGSNHNQFILREKDLELSLHEILNNFDEPFADSSALPSYLVAKQTSNHVKVALTGDGGDEVFGGYNKYYMGKINQRYTRMVPETVHKFMHKTLGPALTPKSDNRGLKFKLNRLLNAVDYSNQYYWDIISLGFASNSLEQVLNPEYHDPDIFHHYKNQSGILVPGGLLDYREVDRHLSLEGDMLVKVDRTSMLTSLECRAPFLNRELWQFTSSLPDSYLMNGWNKKFILKEAFKKDFPEKFLDKSKKGFGVPIGDWLRSTLKSELKEYASPDYLKNQGIFNAESMSRMVRDHLNGKDHTFKVWSFYCFQKWFLFNNLA